MNRTARLMASAHGGQIVVSNVAHALLRDYVFVDFGEHQLRDLSDPERVWGLMFDGAAIFPALRTAAPGRNNLPNARSSFIGRSEELGRVRSLLETSIAVTIVGAGGVGKTRLALEVAANVSWADDGVWLVELGTVRDGDSVC